MERLIDNPIPSLRLGCVKGLKNPCETLRVNAYTRVLNRDTPYRLHPAAFEINSASVCNLAHGLNSVHDRLAAPAATARDSQHGREIVGQFHSERAPCLRIYPAQGTTS